jgi:hypothetical protein
VIRLLLVLLFLLVATGMALADCGDAGDPGYRGPDGACVDWCSLEHTCGVGVRGKCRPEKVSPIILALQSIRRGDPSLPACRQCGCKKGPGYRNLRGKCVGWNDLARTCGSPPTLRCTPELVQIEADAAAAAEAEYAARIGACR